MSHTHLPDPQDARYQDIRRVTVVGAVVDLLLGAAKVIVGLSAGSQALVADGVHSFSDLATDFLVLFAAKHAHREADVEHPYGHGKAEPLAGMMVSMLLMAAARPQLREVCI